MTIEMTQKEKYQKGRRRGYMLLLVVVLVLLTMMLFSGHIGWRLTMVIGFGILALILRGGFEIIVNSARLIHLAKKEGH